jgi:hypothetical protein
MKDFSLEQKDTKKPISKLIGCALVIVLSIVLFPQYACAEWATIVHKFDIGKNDRIYSDSSFSSEISFTGTIEGKYKEGLVVKLVSVSSNCSVSDPVARSNKEGKYIFNFTTSSEGGNLHLKYKISGSMVLEQDIYADTKILNKKTEDTAQDKVANVFKLLAVLAITHGNMGGSTYPDTVVKEYEESEPKDSLFDIYLTDPRGPANGVTIVHHIDGGTPKNHEFTTKIALIASASKPILNENIKIETILPSTDFHLNSSSRYDKEGYYSFDIDSPPYPEINRLVYKVTFPDGSVKYIPEKIVISEDNFESALTGICFTGSALSLGAGVLNWFSGGTLLPLPGEAEKNEAIYGPWRKAYVRASAQFLGAGLLFANANSQSWQDIERYSGTPEANDVIYSNKMDNKLIDSPKGIRQRSLYPRNPNDLEYPDCFAGNGLIAGGSVNGGYQFGIEHNINKQFGLQIIGSFFNGDHRIKVTNSEMLLYFRFFRGFNYFMYAGTGLGQTTREDENLYYKSFTDSENDTFAVIPFKIGFETLVCSNCSLYFDVESLLSSRNPVNYGNIGLKLYLW